MKVLRGGMRAESIRTDEDLKTFGFRLNVSNARKLGAALVEAADAGSCYVWVRKADQKVFLQRPAP